MTTMPVRISGWLAATSGLSAGTLAAMEGRAAWLVLLASVSFAAAIWLMSRRVLAGLVFLVTAVVGLGLVGLRSEDSAAAAIPIVCALVIAGYLLPWRRGALCIPLILAALTAVGPRDAGSVVFGLILLSVSWSFGVLVRSRDVARRHAIDEEGRLADVDPTSRATMAAMAECERQTATAFELISDAVCRMNSAAVRAGRSLDSEAIEALRRTGKDATQTLKELLVLLRAGPETERDGHAISPAHDRPRARWRTGLVRALPAACVFAVWLGCQLWPMPGYVPFAPGGVGLLVAVLFVTVWRDRWPALMPLTAAVTAVLGVASGAFQFSVDVQWFGVAALALCWAAGRAGTRRATAGWLALFGTGVGLTLVLEPLSGNLTIEFIIHLLPFLAGAAWAGQLAAETEHRERGRRHQAEIAAAERRAVAEARLQLARDLHDLASHAVGTMMMQANAALVLRERDPEATRAALATAASVGQETVTALAATSRPGRAYRSGALIDELAAFTSRAAEVGSRVTIEPSDLLAMDLAHEDLDLAARVIREGISNAVRHAPRHDVSVELATVDHEVRVRVTNGLGRDPVSASGTGHGLCGVHELVSARGGRFAAGADFRGAWVLEVLFPAWCEAGDRVP